MTPLFRLLNCGTFLTNCGLVSDKPFVLAKEIVKYGYINGTVDLVCHVEAEPPPSFRWFRKSGKGGKVRDFKGEVVDEDDKTSIAKVILVFFKYHRS